MIPTAASGPSAIPALPGAGPQQDYIAKIQQLIQQMQQQGMQPQGGIQHIGYFGPHGGGIVGIPEQPDGGISNALAPGGFHSNFLQPAPGRAQFDPSALPNAITALKPDPGAANRYGMNRLHLMEQAGLVRPDSRIAGSPAAWWRNFAKNNLVPASQHAGFSDPRQYIASLIQARRPQHHGGLTHPGINQ